MHLVRAQQGSAPLAPSVVHVAAATGTQSRVSATPGLAPVQVCSCQQHLPQGHHGIRVASVKGQGGLQLPRSLLQQLQRPGGILRTGGPPQLVAGAHSVLRPSHALTEQAAAGGYGVLRCQLAAS